MTDAVKFNVMVTGIPQAHIDAFWASDTNFKLLGPAPRDNSVACNADGSYEHYEADKHREGRDAYVSGHTFSQYSYGPERSAFRWDFDKDGADDTAIKFYETIIPVEPGETTAGDCTDQDFKLSTCNKQIDGRWWKATCAPNPPARYVTFSIFVGPADRPMLGEVIYTNSFLVEAGSSLPTGGDSRMPNYVLKTFGHGDFNKDGWDDFGFQLIDGSFVMAYQIPAGIPAR